MPPSPPQAPSRAQLSERPWIAQRYETLEEIARGGMGVVFRVIDHSIGVERALKRVLLRDASRDTLLVSAFEREFRVLSSLDHPRIIRVFEYGVDDDGPYYTMELLRGGDLKRHAPAPWRTVCLHMRDVASSLALLHARRLIHRDLSPGNVKLEEDGHCKLLDFGALSDFGKSKVIVGTPPMIPPEALRGDPLDQRADLYALGALGYWLVTGTHAFPARRLDELRELWERPPRTPSSSVAEIPKALDALLLSLLNDNPLARPSSAAEVIARLNTIAQLAPEDATDQTLLAASFLRVPPFVGRGEALAALQGHLESASRGHGAAIRIEATAGSGRSRLLEEVGLRAQLAGATVLRADASMHKGHLGTVRALVLRLLDALPDVAVVHARAPRFAAAFAALGHEVERRTGARPSRSPSALATTPDAMSELDAWLIELSRHKLLVIEIDSVEYCDDASLGCLVALSQRVSDAALLLVVAERVSLEQVPAKGLLVLRDHCQTLLLPNLVASETLALTHSLFGDAPNLERFAEWLHGRTAGSPLHIVEISRHLVAQQVIKHEAGMWLMPAARPRADLPDALEDALAIRLHRLGAPALSLAQSLSLQRTEPTLELCSLLVDDNPSRLVDGSDLHAPALLDELVRHDVLARDESGYRFSSNALREAIVVNMSQHARESSHGRLGRTIIKVADEADLPLRIEAGWHFMHGGEELRGADIVAAVMSDGRAIRQLSANNYPIGPASDLALKIYHRYRRSSYERLPLLAAIAQAGFFEELHFSDAYADEALDVMKDLSGLRLAHRLRRFIWGWLALGIALSVAALRFVFTPKRERRYSFVELLHQTFGTVTGLVAAATISLDSDRAERITQVLAPFAILPQRDPGRGILAFCTWMAEIGREHPAQAFAGFGVLCQRFADKRWYRQLPDDGRALYTLGTQYARGAFAVFRASGQAALDSATVLESCGLKMYVMIGSQLRFLYYANRGEFALAKPHRERVEVHAAHVGSAWQAELWEDAALLPIYISSGDVVAITRAVRRFDELVQIAPALHLYRRLATIALAFVSHESEAMPVQLAMRELEQRPVRSFIGWSIVLAMSASVHNTAGRHSEARALCERALLTMTDEDREYVALFLHVDIQTAIADAGLGEVDAAFARLDGLLARFEPSCHPMALGLLHECRARIAHRLGRIEEYQASAQHCERWFRGTGTPALIAMSEQLLGLGRTRDRDVAAAVTRDARAAGDGSSSHTTLETETATVAKFRE